MLRISLCNVGFVVAEYRLGSVQTKESPGGRALARCDEYDRTNWTFPLQRRWSSLRTGKGIAILRFGARTQAPWRTRPIFMGLSKYRQIRRFNRTPEPAGKSARSDSAALKFVVQKHDASRLHYDFRLEMEGVLKSWAVPKGPSLDPARKALAVQVEDHPIEYGDFEGVIPQGEYGGGTVLLWDRGTWEPLHEPLQGWTRGKLHFILHGQKLRGEWSLVRMHGKSGGDGKNWLLMKGKDKFASKDDVLIDEPASVKTRRQIEQIAEARDDIWSSDAKEAAKSRGARKAAMPAKFTPQLAVLADRPPEGHGWLHEIKFDGYRILAHIKNGNVKLMTPTGMTGRRSLRRSQLPSVSSKLIPRSSMVKRSCSMRKAKAISNCYRRC